MRDTSLDILLACFIEGVNACSSNSMSDEQLIEMSKRHLSIVKPLVLEHGWPDNVDDELHLFSVVIHADHDVEFQKLCLGLMTRKASNKTLIAYLTDRILVNEGEPQVFGTQMVLDPQLGRNVLYPVRDLITLDRRRLMIGLPPLEECLF